MYKRWYFNKNTFVLITKVVARRPLPSPLPRKKIVVPTSGFNLKTHLV